jgi:hypothetical protein
VDKVKDNIFLQYAIGGHSVVFGEVFDLTHLVKRKQNSGLFWEEITAITKKGEHRLTKQHTIPLDNLDIIRADYDAGYRGDTSFNKAIETVEKEATKKGMSVEEIQRQKKEMIKEHIFPRLVEYITGVGSKLEGFIDNALLALALYQIVEKNVDGGLNEVNPKLKTELDAFLDRKYNSIRNGTEDEYVTNINESELLSAEDRTLFISGVGRYIGPRIVNSALASSTLSLKNQLGVETLASTIFLKILEYQ